MRISDWSSDVCSSDLAVLRKPEDLDAAWARLGGQALILEAFVPFERELSCLAVRGKQGELRFYPVVENVHRDGILRVSRPRPNDPLQASAEAYATRMLAHLGYVGVDRKSTRLNSSH